MLIYCKGDKFDEHYYVYVYMLQCFFFYFIYFYFNVKNPLVFAEFVYIYTYICVSNA